MRTPEDTPSDADQIIREGTIASVDADTRMIVVELDDESLTPPIKWFEAGAGPMSTGTDPEIGEGVMLLCPGGEIGAARALRGLPRPGFPQIVKANTALVKYKDGTTLSYDWAAHQLVYTLAAGATFKVVAEAGVTFEGPLHCTGPITSDGEISGAEVKAGGIALGTHKHEKVAAGLVISGGPVA
ncbi:phage baseplate assembly protein V [Novosphingobium sp.]|uniref:phage baseplate assembly protein V n=1 Tax=Novosphingobium sp. TaxID=1874826 RepID=UPI0031D1E59D